MAKQNNKPHRSVVITAIVVVGALMAYALNQGFNGTLLTGAVAIIAGMAGWVVPGPKLKTH
jgi:uncharacterized membrane protein